MKTGGNIQVAEVRRLGKTILKCILTK